VCISARVSTWIWPLDSGAERCTGCLRTREPARAFLVQQAHLGAAQPGQAAQHLLSLSLLHVPEMAVPVREGGKPHLVKRERRGRVDEVEAMNSAYGPWNQVAVIHPSSCQTRENSSHRPASRSTTQSSTTLRIADAAAKSNSPSTLRFLQRWAGGREIGAE
jgi:hypothetical protein